ncbi:MAG TPA: hypothetical protein VMZ30_18855 [Pyrinomonadaceae bacterium]|nr:hypothetical protein [Pyrinomonadaceae bacterium]
MGPNDRTRTLFFRHILVNSSCAFDLKKYLDVFPDVCKAKFGRKFDFQTIEKDFSQFEEVLYAAS